MTPPDPTADPLRSLLAAHLPRQRWYAGPAELAAGEVVVVGPRELWASEDGARRLLLALVDAAGDRYQVLLGQRPAGEPAEFLNSHEEALLGPLGGSYLYDATRDPELARLLLPIVTGGAETASLVRPVSAEQSNTSLVFDDRFILKVFRRLAEGPNPDVEVTTALVGVGFDHVARPVGVWREGGTDLAFAQEYLAGGSEGWALALTSLRDFYDSPVDDPGEAGGDFGMEATRLGQVTAQLHGSLRDAFGAGPVGAPAWAALVEDIAERLGRFAAAEAAEAGGAGAGESGGVAALVPAALARLRAVTAPGPGLRVHGDYHLGQVMRADGGWYVLDFEGEPDRPVDERTRLASPLKDLAGMLRSFDYAARAGLVERGGSAGDANPKAAAWVRHNRAAFVRGYLAEECVADLLPPNRFWDTLLAAHELDKALYEVDYERGYRPGWMPIPAAAVGRIVERLVG